MVIDLYNRKEALKEKRLQKIRRKQVRVIVELARKTGEQRRGLVSLSAPIPNQYAQQGVAFSYTFPATTFGGTDLVYTAFINRPIIGRNLPTWLAFDPATRTFSGTATNWWELETLQVVVSAHEAAAPATKAYSIFLLTVGASDNVGRPCWRAGSTPNHVVNAANIGSFNAANVTAGQWVVIDTDLTKDPLTQSSKDKINTIRANGGYLVWKWNNTNGLYAHRANRIDFEFIEAGETVAVDFSAGNTKAFNPDGKLWKGLRGKEIYVTNYDAPGYITSRNYANNQNVSAIRFTRFDSQKQDCHIRVVGQPNNHTPNVNMYGIGLTEGLAFQVDGSNGYCEAAYLEVRDCTIGFHWKGNTSLTRGDRRPSENLNGWDDNQYHTQIHDCNVHDTKTECIYLGGGSWNGISIKSFHYNEDGSKKEVLNNGVLVHEYHWVRRFNAIHEHVRIEHCIFKRAGWDAIQVRNVTREMRVMYNYIFETAVGATVNNIQAEGIMADSTVGEIAYNYIERAFFAPLRVGMLGLDSIHHNITVDAGQYNYGNANLDAPKAGTSIYASNRGMVHEDRPAMYVADYQNWDSLATYPDDTFQHAAKVKLNGKSYRSIKPDNVGNNPETSPTWWEDTREWVSGIVRPDVTLADLFFKLYHNTCVNSKYNTIEIGVATPAAQRYIKNNLFVNCNSTVVNGGTGSNTANNIAVTGVLLADYFVDPVNKDYRLKALSPAIGGGADLTLELTGTGAFHDGFKDYSGGAHLNPPSRGVFEDGAVVGNHYSFAANGQSGTVTPGPITIDAGPDVSFNLPQNSITITATKSDTTRVLDTMTWLQLNGPNGATIGGQGTLTATFSNLVQGTYTFMIDTYDQYGHNASDQVNVTVNPEGIVTESTFQWYVADDANGTNKAAIAGANAKAYTPSAYVGLNKWFARGERPVAKTGVLIGQENMSNWVNVP